MKRPGKKRPKRSKFAPVRHPFLYRLEAPDGTAKVKPKMARVKLATKPVTITLTADHVRKSMQLKGAGNTAKCAAAVCSVDHADSFPHPVEGHVDMQAARLFVATSHDKIGLPETCVVYEHNAGAIAKLNDTPGGQKKLLALIERDGPLVIELKPYRRRSKPGRPGKGRFRTGAREKKPRGARLRYFVLQTGALAAPDELARGRRGQVVRRRKKAA